MNSLSDTIVTREYQWLLYNMVQYIGMQNLVHNMPLLSHPLSFTAKIFSIDPKIIYILRMIVMYAVGGY